MLIYESTLFGPLAQLVEQLTLNQRVAGSSPSRPIGCQTHVIGTFLASSDVSKRMCAVAFFVFLDKFLDSNLFFIKINVKRVFHHSKLKSSLKVRQKLTFRDDYFMF